MKDALDDDLTRLGRVEDHVRLVAKAKQAALQVVRAPAHARIIREILKDPAKSGHVDVGLPRAKHELRGLEENLDIVFGRGRKPSQPLLYRRDSNLDRASATISSKLRSLRPLASPLSISARKSARCSAAERPSK